MMKPQTFKKLVLTVLAASVATGTMLGAVEAAERKRAVKAQKIEKVLKGEPSGGVIGIPTGNGTPDLVIMPAYAGNNGMPLTGYCAAWQPGNTKIVLRVKNNGTGASTPSKTNVHFTANINGATVVLNTPALNPGQWTQHTVSIPPNSWSNSAVYFSMYADILNEIVEIQENNNSNGSTCFGPAT